MITITSLILVVITIIFSMWLAWTLYHTPPVSADATWLTKEELGKFEERLKDCKEVILKADLIDTPTRENAPSILFALIDNFIEKVEYNFLVPQQYYQENYERVTGTYNNIIKLAEDISGIELKTTNLFKLHKQPFENIAPDFPYLFYRFTTKSGESEVVAFRGEDIGLGIANYYRRLEPEVAQTILAQLLPYIHPEGFNAADYSEYAGANTVIEFKRPDRRIKESA